MKRRNFFNRAGNAALGILVGYTLFQLLNGCSFLEGKKQWNIVFILSDDQGWNQVGYHGFDFYETPHIDRIASEGMHFTDAYAAAPVCSPTRASIITGKHPARLHLTDYIPGNPWPYQKLITPQMVQGLPLEEVTIPELLKNMGYVTGHFGKWHLNKDKDYLPGRPGDPGSQGFDEVLTTVKPPSEADPDADAHHAVEITNGSLKFIEDHQNEPFFLYVPHHVVHRPLMEHKDLIAKYKAKTGSDEPVHNPIMGAMIERMDTGIGQILEKLDELNLSEKTIVIFMSDNGGLEQLQDQAPLRGGKATIFEGGLKVPFAIRWPGVIKPGTSCSTPVISHDLFPTIMEMVGLSYEKETLDGMSLMPLLNESGDLERDAIFFHYPHYHHQGFKPAGAIREGDYKLIEWYEETLLGLDDQFALYNVREDIGETRDLAGKMSEKAKAMRLKLHNWLTNVGAQEMRVNPKYEPNKANIRREDK
jgi:arylsulfatase A-like enzyme